MNRRARLIVIYVLAGLALLLWLQSSFSAPENRIPYTTFKQDVVEGKVAEVRVGEKTITGRFQGQGGKADGTFETVRIDDPSLLKDLEQHGVKSTGVAEGGGALTVLLSWLLPIGIMVAIWLFLMRRVGQQAQGGILSFGKSRIKLVSEKEVGVTFKDVAGVDEAKAELCHRTVAPDGVDRIHTYRTPRLAS
jgi:cell division protease FtsH